MTPTKEIIKVLEIKSCVECKNCIDRFCLLLDDYFPDEFEEKGGIYKDCLLPDAKDFDTKALESIKAMNCDPNRVKQVKEFYEEGTLDVCNCDGVTAYTREVEFCGKCNKPSSGLYTRK